MITTSIMRLGARSLALALALCVAASPTTASASPGTPAPTAAPEPAPVVAPAKAPDAVAAETSVPPEPAPHDPVAEQAYADGSKLLAKGEHAEAIAKLDLAAELEPTWSEPVRLRAEAFAGLAERYEPSAAFTSAHAKDLELLLALEPEADPVARQRQIDALRQHAAEAEALEQRRRRLRLPAFMVIIAATGITVAGAMLYGMKTREFLMATAYRQERRDQAGIVLMAVGGALIPPAIVLGVMASRQSRRDEAVRDLEIQTGRKRATLSAGPQLVRGGGGASLTLRF